MMHSLKRSFFPALNGLTLAKGGLNPILSWFMAALTRLGVASRRWTVGIAGVREQSEVDHEQIVAALKRRDAESARKAMLQHRTHVEQQLEAVSIASEG